MALDGQGARRRILLRDVAARANVSDSTASRALADDPRISIATRLTVKAAATELHYIPNAAARSLRVRRTRTMGLLLPDLRDPVHGQVASAFEREARHEGYSVMIVAGERVSASYLVMTLPYSDAFFCCVFPKECTETFQEGHVRAFEFFGGVPTRISY